MSNATPKGIFEIGDVLNNTYRIEEVLGRGGTSEVYRARSEISGRVVALKALRSEFSRNEDFLALMTREEDMREIRHDAVVRYYDNQRTDDGHIYLVMDYVDGPGLDTMLKNGGMSAEDLLIVCKRVCEGLAVAHSKNIVHRDLSPDNIILRNAIPAEAVIIDFGIAKDSNPGAETIVGNEFAGKYAYAAPEQLSGQTDARADVYALGALLLSTFRGAAPDIGNNPMEVVERKGKPLNTDGVPEPLKSLIDQMTHPDRDQRLSTAEEVLARIENPSLAAPVPADPEDLDRTIIAPRPAPSKAEPEPVSSAPEAELESLDDILGAVEEPAAKPVDVPKPAEVKAPKKGSGAGLWVGLAAAVLLAGGGAGAYFSGMIGGGLPVADPYTLMAGKSESGQVVAFGNAPSAEVADSITGMITALGGEADLTLASGDISASWGAGIVQLMDAVDDLPEWSINVTGNSVQIAGLTNDRDEHDQLGLLLSPDNLPEGLKATANIELGPRIVLPEALQPILQQFSDCGELNLVGAPPLGYGQDAQVIVAGRVAEIKSRVGLIDALTAQIGNRPLIVETEVLNPTLCLIDSALPNAPQGGFKVAFGFGDRADPNPSGRYFVGENPTIDIEIPADVTTGFLFVSALDVSGNVFHLLPNLYSEKNAIEDLRAGRSGPITVRVAYSLQEASGGDKLAFVVDDTALGKTKIIAIHSETQIFDGMRPTTESADGYAKALQSRTGRINSLDSRILTTTAKP